MPYYNIGELEYDILITDNKSEHDEKIPDRIVNAINHIKDTDTKITLPWIREILKRNAATSPWDQAYHHWMELRKIFGKKENDDEKTINSTDILKSLNRTDQIAKLERSKKIQDHILSVADAIQEIKVSHQNLKDVLALICIIKGISFRFKNLDQGQMNGIITNWMIYCLTQIIISQSGKNREDNFAPLVDSIEKLTNSSILTRRLIPKNIIPKTKIRKKFVHFKPNINTNNNDRKFNLEHAIIQSTNIELDIKNAKDDFIEKLIHYEDARKKIAELKKVEEDIYTALDSGQVLPYEPRYVEIFPLHQRERMSWESYASQQNYYYFILFSLIKKIMGYYESPYDIMSPLLQFIQSEENELLKEYHSVQASNAEYQRLKKIKVKLNLDIQTTKIAMKCEKQSKESDKNPEEKYSFFVDLEKSDKHKFNNINWKRYMSAMLKIISWTMIGIAAGFGVGTLIGTFFGGGIANIISIPFCMLVGGVVGFCASAMYVYAKFNDPSIFQSTKISESQNENTVSQNIYKKLNVQPKIINNHSLSPMKESDQDNEHLDHKHSKPNINQSFEPALNRKTL